MSGISSGAALAMEAAIKLGDKIKKLPMWPMWEAVAPTIAYDVDLMGEDASIPTQKAARVAVPTLVIAGAESEPSAHITAKALTKAMPYAHYHALEGQAHEVAPEALAPVLIEFFDGSDDVKPKKMSRRKATAKGK